jgi:hypothetical protein
VDLKSAIRGRIAKQSPFGVWTPVDFLDLGSRDAIDQALSRMTAAGDIRRITRGLYDLPRPNKLTGSSWALKPLPSDRPHPAGSIGRAAPACAWCRRCTGCATC